MNKDNTSFIELFQAHPIPMWVYDLQTLAFLTVNTAAIEHYGYTKAEFLAMTIEAIRPSYEKERLRQNLHQQTATAFEKSGIWLHKKKDGSIINVEITSHPLHFEGRLCKFVLAHDVTERLHAQDKISRLSRIYAVLSRINYLIVRTRDRAALFQDTCRIATEEAEFLAAYIAIIDPDTLDGSVVAWAGDVSPRLGAADLNFSSEMAASPAMMAVRTGLPAIYNDILEAPDMFVPDARFIESQVASMAAFPLHVDKRPVGVLVLFADTPHCFDEAEQKLLTELAADVAFSFQYIGREESRKHANARLQESEAGLRRAQLMNKTAHVITGPDGTFERWSDTLPILIGVDNTAMPPNTRRWLDIVHLDDQSKFRHTCIQAARHGLRVEIEYRVRRGDGNLIQLKQVMEPLLEHGVTHGKTRWFNTIQDITEQKAQQEKIARLSRIYAVLSGINSAIVRTHNRMELFQETCRVAVHEGAFGMAWVASTDTHKRSDPVVALYSNAPDLAAQLSLKALAKAPDHNLPSDIAVREMRLLICNNVQADSALANFKDELLAQGHLALACLPLVTENRVVAVLTLFASTIDFFDEDEIKLLNELAGDLSFALQFIDKEEQLSYLAFYDKLTGLPNSRLFNDRLSQLMHSSTHESNKAAIILLNLNRFSQLNDALGRHAGDNLLIQIAERLQASLQEPYTLARIAGDTFAIGLANLAQGGDAASILEHNVFNAFAEDFLLDHQPVRVSVSAGLALYPDDGANTETLYKHAEVALKNAKISGERYLFYAPLMNAALAAKLLLENELRTALSDSQFVMYFQPRVDLLSGHIVSAEALIRWQHPERGLIYPGDFIPVAEDTGLIVQIGEWAIKAVCAQQAAWREQQIDIVPVAVNLSAVQFKNGKILDIIQDAINSHGLEQHHIEFELTESVVMGNPEEAAQTLKAIKTMGMQLSLDDFGTGYSSLAYLKRFPFDFVKIDRAFIIDVTNNPGDAAITTAVIAMAHSLNLRVVAEGVETEGQLQLLRRLRCDEIQGYYFSRPVPADAFATMLREGKRLSPTKEFADDTKTLLIVDDEPNIGSALKRLLRVEGYRILTATSGQQGLDLLAVNPVQVIISDQRMPGMVGTEFLRIVKELYPDTIRIILSGYSDLVPIAEGVNRGEIFKFLTKPWDDAQLKENIRDAFRRHRPDA
ncbi:EAL domain-containing protein [Undibacterium sp. Ji83W]|uniref:EAL domain-containing protein n=1 Tax=Undibacterium sp. Ji83W TaxID=3413043 RepID=UPI003BF189D5